MRIRSRAAVQLSIALALQLSIAGAAEAQVFLRGAGVAPCGLWVEARQAEGDAAKVSGLHMMENWILGYLSAVAARTSKDLLREGDVSSHFKWLDGYCRANVLTKSLAHGVEALAQELEQKIPARK